MRKINSSPDCRYSTPDRHKHAPYKISFVLFCYLYLPVLNSAKMSGTRTTSAFGAFVCTAIGCNFLAQRFLPFVQKKGPYHTATNVIPGKDLIIASLPVHIKCPIN